MKKHKIVSLLGDMESECHVIFFGMSLPYCFCNQLCYHDIEKLWVKQLTTVLCFLVLQLPTVANISYLVKCHKNSDLTDSNRILN